METRITQSTFEASGRKFIIKKMTPLMGIAILKELISRSLPIDLLSMMDSAGAGSKLKSIMSFSSSMVKPMGIDEFVEFEQRILLNVYELLPSGEVQVIDTLGNYKVLDLENDMSLVLRLLVETIKVNYKDFFIEILQEVKLIFKDEEEVLE